MNRFDCDGCGMPLLSRTELREKLADGYATALEKDEGITGKIWTAEVDRDTNPQLYSGAFIVGLLIISWIISKAIELDPKGDFLIRGLLFGTPFLSGKIASEVCKHKIKRKLASLRSQLADQCRFHSIQRVLPLAQREYRRLLLGYLENTDPNLAEEARKTIEESETDLQIADQAINEIVARENNLRGNEILAKWGCLGASKPVE